MPSWPLRMLLVQSWVVPGTAMRAALQAAGYEPKIVRVDFEPALAAALSRSIYDVIVLDPISTGIARATVDSLVRDHGLRIPVIELAGVDGLPDAVRAALASLRN